MSKLKTLREKYKHIEEDTFDNLKYISGNNYKYLEWYLKNFKEISKDINLEEYDDDTGDFPGMQTLEDLILKFEKHAGKLSSKDIYSFSFKKLNEELEKILPSASEIKKSEAHTVYEDDNMLIVHPFTYEAHKLYAANTKWCTSSSYYTFKDYNYINYLYKSNKYSIVVILIDKSNNDKYAVQISFDLPDYAAADLLKNEKTRHNLCIKYDVYNAKDVCIQNLNSGIYNVFNKIVNNEKYGINFSASEITLILLKYSASLMKESLSFKNPKMLSELATDKFIANIYKNNNFSNVDLLKFLQTCGDNTLVKNYLNIFNFAHDASCPSLKASEKKTNKNKQKVKESKLESDLLKSEAKLEKCSCSKFNNLEFLESLSSSLKKLKPKKTDLISFENINKILLSKINKFKVISSSKKEILNYCLTNTDYDVNVVLDQISLEKNELLFLQVHAKNDKVKTFCSNKTKVPSDFAEEYLKLKNISSIKDL